ncbi:MAG: hypothetical protein ABII64_06935, partial [Elusimicrobiota bacterium]
WIENLMKGVIMKFIPLKQIGDLYGRGSYVAKAVFDGEAIKREYLPLRQTFYKSGNVCQLEINPADCNLSIRDYVAVKLLWGKAKTGTYKDSKGEENKIKETYFQITCDPKEVKSFWDCLKKIKFSEVKSLIKK